MQAAAGWTAVTGKKMKKKQNTKSTPRESDNEMVVESPKDISPKAVPEEVVSPLTNVDHGDWPALPAPLKVPCLASDIHPEGITQGCTSLTHSPDSPMKIKLYDETHKEDNTIEASMSRFPSPNRKRRVSLAKSLESAVAAPHVAAVEQEVHDAVQSELPKEWIGLPAVEYQTQPACDLEMRIWPPAPMNSLSPTQMLSESPSKSLAQHEVFNFPGSPKTDLEYKQILACHGKGSPKAASLEMCDVADLAELKQLIEKGPPGLAPPRASEAESARKLAGVPVVPQRSWAKVAAGGLAKSSEDAPSSGELMDVVLMECFLQAIRTRVKAWNLPIKGTTLYTQHMRQCRRIGTSLNVKESTYHCLGAFLQHLEKQGLLMLKPGETDAVIIDICRNHPEIEAWQPWPLEATHEGLTNSGEMTEQQYMA